MRFRFIAAICVAWIGSSAALATIPADGTLVGNPNARDHRWRPALAPLGAIRFCMEYPQQCERKRVSIRKPRVALTEARIAQLRSVQQQVNRAIIAQPEKPGAPDRWKISPRRGDCDDYAVTKRAALLAMGWPSSALLLTHTVTAMGDDHLVLTVRTAKQDFVLDNLAGDVREARFSLRQIVKIQTHNNPEMWVSPVARPQDFRLARAAF